MTKYAVNSPYYQVPRFASVVDIDPPEHYCAYVEVEAGSVREAKVLAVRHLRKNNEMRYCDDGQHPFSGLEVLNCDSLQEIRNDND